VRELAERLASGWANRFQAPNPLTAPEAAPLPEENAGQEGALPLAAIIRAVAQGDRASLENRVSRWSAELARSGATPEEVMRAVWTAVGSLWCSLAAGPLNDAFSRLRRHILYTAAQSLRGASEAGGSVSGGETRPHARHLPALAELLSSSSYQAGTELDPLLHEIILRAKTFRLATYRRKQLIFSPTTASHPVHILIDGHVRLFELLRDGRAVTLALLGPGDIFSASPNAPATPLAAYAESFRASHQIILPRTEFVRLLPGAPALTTQTIQSFQRQITDLRRLVASLLSRDVATRLAHIFLRLADHFGSPTGDGAGLVHLTVSITHRELADMIGSNRVTVTNKLRDMERRGLIRRGPQNRLTIHCPQLEQLLV